MMLLAEVLVFALFGLLTSLTLDIFINKHNKPILTFFLLLEGAFFGWLSGVMWVYITGGLDLNVFSLIIPVIVSAFFTTLTLMYLPIRTGRIKGVGVVGNVFSFVLLGGIIVALFLSTVPPTNVQAFNTEEFATQTEEWQIGQRTMDANTIGQFTVTPTNAIPITTKCATSSIKGLMMMEEPQPGSYMDFMISMDVGGVWKEPYVKIAVFQDTDGDGKLSIGDIMWADSSYKMVLSSSDWRTNCVWENNQPVSCAFSTDSMILPIFHATGISMWKDDANQVFTNTPEGYVAPNDMMSWEKTGNTITLKENVLAYGSINSQYQIIDTPMPMSTDSNEVTTINGKLYVQGVPSGNNFILVRTYDASSTDPFDESANPITEQYVPFQVAGLQTGGIGSEWMILVGLGAIVGALVFIEIKYDD